MKKELSFNDLPEGMSQILDVVLDIQSKMSVFLEQKNHQPRENRHRTITPGQLAAFIQIPIASVYQKLERGEIPATKPGKRWIIFLDEVDKWLEVNRKNPIPLTDSEMNESIKKSHRRKAKTKDWMMEAVEEHAITDGNAAPVENSAVTETGVSAAVEVEGKVDAETEVEASSKAEADSKVESGNGKSNGTNDRMDTNDADLSFSHLESLYPRRDATDDYRSASESTWNMLSAEDKRKAIAYVQSKLSDGTSNLNDIYLSRFLKSQPWQNA